MNQLTRTDDLVPMSQRLAHAAADARPGNGLPPATTTGTERVSCTRTMRSALVERFPCASRDLHRRRLDDSDLTSLDVVVWSYEWSMIASDQLGSEVSQLRDELTRLDINCGNRREASPGPSTIEPDDITDPVLTRPADCLGLPVSAIVAWIDSYTSLSVEELHAWSRWNRRIASTIRRPWTY